MRERYGTFRTQGRRFAVVVRRTNELVTRQLLAGALDCLRQHDAGDDQVDVYWVPGGWEIAPVVARVASHGGCSAVIALGAIIRGATPHFDHLASAVFAALSHAMTRSGTYVSLGILTTDTLEQALERAGSKAGNQGWNAALAAIEMADLIDKLDGESD